MHVSHQHLTCEGHSIPASFLSKKRCRALNFSASAASGPPQAFVRGNQRSLEQRRSHIEPAALITSLRFSPLLLRRARFCSGSAKQLSSLRTSCLNNIVVVSALLLRRTHTTLRRFIPKAVLPSRQGSILGAPISDVLRIATLTSTKRMHSRRPHVCYWRLFLQGGFPPRLYF